MSSGDKEFRKMRPQEQHEDLAGSHRETTEPKKDDRETVGVDDKLIGDDLDINEACGTKKDEAENSDAIY